MSIHFLTELFERNLIKEQSIFPLVIILLILISFSLDYELINSDFVTNSYGESWDSVCEKSWVPVWLWTGTQFVKNHESQSTTSESHLKNAWAFMELDS